MNPTPAVNPKDLSADAFRALDDELKGECSEAFQKLIETHSRITQHNFLTNAGGAAAVLAYLSTNPTPTFAFISLFIFTAGTIASGIEIKSLGNIYAAIHLDALRRRRGFNNNSLKLEDCVPPADLAKRDGTINRYAGNFSQLCFAVGALAGAGMAIHCAT